MENKKRTYIKSEIKVYPMANDNLLQAASGNAGSIGYGGKSGDAKRNFIVEEWEEDVPLNPSKGEESCYSGYNAWEE